MPLRHLPDTDLRQVREVQADCCNVEHRGHSFFFEQQRGDLFQLARFELFSELVR